MANLRYLSTLLLVVLLGLASRRWAASLPLFVATYAGDTLWGLMVLLVVSAVALHLRLAIRGGLAVAISFLVEFSQLYRAPWIDTIRHTWLGGKLLGYGILWSDLICYLTGIALGLASIRFLTIPWTNADREAS